MKTRSFILVALVGLMGGMGTGLYWYDRPDRRAGRHGESAEAGEARSGGPSGNPLEGMVAPVEDERLMRLFSALQHPIRMRRQVEIHVALQAIAPEEFAVLVGKVESLPRALAKDLLDALIERWFEVDLKAAQRWALERPMTYTVLEAWAQVDPESAWQVALERRAWWSQIMMGEVFERQDGQDYAKMLAKTRAIPPGQMQQSAWQSIFASWARQNPEAAFQAVSQVPEGSRLEFYRSVISTVADQAPEWALQKLGELIPSMKAGVLGNDTVDSVVGKVAQREPRLALDWLVQQPEAFRGMSAINISREWAKKEPMEALRWCVDHGVDIARVAWYGSSNWQPSVLGGAMESAPRETFSWLRSLEPGENRDRLLECAFMESMWHTPPKQIFGDEAALAWELYRALPEESQIAKSRLFAEKRISSQSSSEAVDWITDFPAGAARENAIQAAMDALAEGSVTKAEKFLGMLPPGGEHDAGLSRFAVGISGESPGAGAARAMEIRDPILRRETLDEIVVPWLVRDQREGQAWMQSAHVPQEWKNDWLKLEQQLRAK